MSSSGDRGHSSDRGHSGSRGGGSTGRGLSSGPGPGGRKETAVPVPVFPGTNVSKTSGPRPVEQPQSRATGDSSLNKMPSFMAGTQASEARSSVSYLSQISAAIH